MTGPFRQQGLLYGQLVMLPAKPASHPVMLYPAPALLSGLAFRGLIWPCLLETLSGLVFYNSSLALSGLVF